MHIDEVDIQNFSFEFGSFVSIPSHELDGLLIEAAKVVIEHQQGSVSLLQRKFKIGYNRAGRIIDQLYNAGVVGPFVGSTARHISINGADNQEKLLKILKSIIDMADLFLRSINADDVYQERLNYENRKIKEIEEYEKLKIKKRLLEKERGIRLKREARQELDEAGLIPSRSPNRRNSREPIPQNVMDKVWNRDGGKCVRCESREQLEFDHIIPYSRGGANTYRNLQLLCKNAILKSLTILANQWQAGATKNLAGTTLFGQGKRSRCETV